MRMAETRQRYEMELRLRERIITALRMGNLELLRHFAYSVRQCDNPMSEWMSMRVGVPDIVVVDPSGGEVVFYSLEDAEVAAIYRNLDPSEFGAATNVDNGYLGPVHHGGTDRGSSQEDWQKRYMELAGLLTVGNCEVNRQIETIGNLYNMWPILEESHGNQESGSLAPEPQINAADVFRCILGAFDVVALVIMRAASLANTITGINLPPVLSPSVSKFQKNTENRRQTLREMLAKHRAKTFADKGVSAPGDSDLHIAPETPQSTGCDHTNLGKRRRAHPLSIAELADLIREREKALLLSPRSCGCSTPQIIMYDSEEEHHTPRSKRRATMDANITMECSQRQPSTSKAHSSAYPSGSSNQADRPVCPGSGKRDGITFRPRRRWRRRNHVCKRFPDNGISYHQGDPTDDIHASFHEFSTVAPLFRRPRLSSGHSSDRTIARGVRHLTIDSSGDMSLDW